jgi:hypothetical protein
MDRNAVQRLDPHYLGEFVYDARGEKDFGNDAARAVGTAKSKAVLYRPDIGHPRPPK